MGTMETLYAACTGLGTVIFILIFVNYYLESGDEEEAPAPGSRRKRDAVKAKRQ